MTRLPTVVAVNCSSTGDFFLHRKEVHRTYSSSSSIYISSSARTTRFWILLSEAGIIDDRCDVIVMEVCCGASSVGSYVGTRVVLVVVVVVIHITLLADLYWYEC